MKRIEELDFARVIAMIAVIMIHVTSAYIGYQSNILVMGMNLAFILCMCWSCGFFGISLFLKGECRECCCFRVFLAYCYFAGPHCLENQSEKLRKTTVFHLKYGGFMVAEAGFEPTTSGL